MITQYLLAVTRFAISEYQVALRYAVSLQLGCECRYGYQYECRYDPNGAWSGFYEFTDSMPKATFDLSLVLLPSGECRSWNHRPERLASRQ